MKLSVRTKAGNFYTYLRSSNRIVEEDICEELKPLSFNPLKYIADFPELSVFTIALTHQCNLRCTYCCYSGAYRNTRTHGNSSFSSQDVDSILDFIDSYNRKENITISFYGGECLLEFSLIKVFVEKAVNRWTNRVHFEISTNGTLINGRIAEWLIENKVTLFVSLDGTSKYQDKQRLTKDGKGTFQVIMQGLYLLERYNHDYFEKNVNLMMTLTDVKEIKSIAEEWHKVPLLRNKMPIRISSVFPNYAKGVGKDNVEELLHLYLDILNFYEANKELTLLGVFFERFLAEWIERPIFEIDEPLDYPTCVPNNTKIYIDTDGKIGICEKLPDAYRIGSLKDGVNWKEVNNVAGKMEALIKKRCALCPVARLCDICPNVLDLSIDEMDIYCYNQKVLQNVKLRVFCELAERGLI